MWERMLDGVLAVMFAVISALMCSYVMVRTGMGGDIGTYAHSLWLLLGTFGVIYGAVLATSRPRKIHYLLVLPLLLWLVAAGQGMYRAEQGMGLYLKCAGAGINLLCLVLMFWSRKKKKS